jgi:16S rRNA (guanine527-N7)-methyltransferase
LSEPEDELEVDAAGENAAADEAEKNRQELAGSSSLEEALARRDIQLKGKQVTLLERYCERLWDWNEKINLTRHTTYDKFVARDVVDSLELAKLLEKDERVLDVGTGGGVPGVILAILRPDLTVVLNESVGKKARAVAEIVQEAKIRVPVVHGAVQHHMQDATYDTLVVRAVAALPKLLIWTRPHWHRFGRLLLIKGPAWVEERKEARERRLMTGLELRKVASYPLEGTYSESVILQINPQAK